MRRFLLPLAVCLTAFLNIAPVSSFGPGNVMAAEPLRIAYLIPGSNKEPFWQSAHAFAQAAADDLGFVLEVHYAFNDAKRLLATGKAVAARAQDKPDYILFHNYEGAAPYILNAAERNGVYAFLVGTRLSDSVQDQVKGPRVNFKKWLGELRTDNVGGGYALARMMFRAAHERKLVSASGRYKMVVMNGSVGDVAAIDRQDGAKLAAEEYYHGDITMRAVADWSRIKARAITARAFEKQPTASLYWVANDLMALGALDTFERTRRIPGVDTLIGCFNWSPWALKAVAENQIEFVLGGHFMEAGAAIVLLFDHSRGQDFADQGTSFTHDHGLVTKANVRAVYQRMVRNDFSSIDFRVFSRVMNPNWQRYEFDAMTFLAAMK